MKITIKHRIEQYKQILTKITKLIVKIEVIYFLSFLKLILQYFDNQAIFLLSQMKHFSTVA